MKYICFFQALAINGQELIITDAITSRIQNRGMHASVVFGTGEDVHITGKKKIEFNTFLK